MSSKHSGIHGQNNCGNDCNNHLGNYSDEYCGKHSRKHVGNILDIPGVARFLHVFQITCGRRLYILQRKTSTIDAIAS